MDREEMTEALGLEHWHGSHDDDECGEDCCDVTICEDVELEPECRRKHAWSPKGMGGCAANPGVWSIGGTAFEYRDACTHCGVVRVIVRLGCQRNPGQCDSVRFELEDN
jgi:hypothetical protein